MVQYENQRAHCNYLKRRSKIRKFLGKNFSIEESYPLISLHPAKKKRSYAFVNVTLNYFSCSRSLTVFTTSRKQNLVSRQCSVPWKAEFSYVRGIADWTITTLFTKQRYTIYYSKCPKMQEVPEKTGIFF